jgi:hypothetical protein
MKRSFAFCARIVVLLACVLLTLGCKRPAPQGEAHRDAQPGGTAVDEAPVQPPASAQPQGERSAFLWRIEGEAPSFLLGTIHVPDPRVSVLPRAVQQAFEASQVVLTEIPMDARTQLEMAPMLLLPRGKTLKDELPAALYTRLQSAFESRGFPLEPLSSLKIWAVSAHVVLLDRLLELATRKPLDAQLFERALQSGKQAEGLETPSEQVAAFDALSRQEQLHLLSKTLEQREHNRKHGKDPIEELLVAWLSGDEDKMAASILEEYDPSDPVDAKVMKRVLYERNEVMARRIEARLKASPSTSHFFAIGTAHLVGADNIVERLSNQGRKLARVK